MTWTEAEPFVRDQIGLRGWNSMGGTSLRSKIGCVIVDRTPPDFPHTHPHSREQAVARHLVATQAHRLGLPCGQVVEHGPTGQPYFPGCDLNLSISHDRGIVAVATSPHPIGVDVQHVSTVSDRFRRQLLAENAERRVQNPACDAEAVRSWVIREAIAKCRGRGLADCPWRYELSTLLDFGVYEECEWETAYLAGYDVWIGVAVRRDANHSRHRRVASAGLGPTVSQGRLRSRRKEWRYLTRNTSLNT